jgi:enolase
MSNFTITNIIGRQIIDSRGNPTVEADVYLSDGTMGRAAVPSGASTGSGEALELRDGGDQWVGKGVSKAVANINGAIRERLQGFDASDQSGLDAALIELDGTENKASLGANAILAVSLAAAKATASAKKQPLHQYIAEMTGTTQQSLPLPMMNVMNGGQHAAGSTDVQEYMIVPIGASDFTHAMRIGTEVFHALGKVLKEAGYGTTVGDEGGYAPAVKNGNREPLELIAKAVEKAGYNFGTDVALALDVASSELYENGNYNLTTEGRTVSASELIDWYQSIRSEFPIVSIEDGLDENDWTNWTELTSKLGGDVQLVGDDLLVTNTKLLQRAIDEKAANAILIKPNQIGTLSETINAVKTAQAAGWNTVMSHRSGETEDVTIAHLAVGLGCGQIKTGSLSRTDRIAKYNELLRIAEAAPELRLAKPFQSK